MVLQHDTIRHLAKTNTEGPEGRAALYHGSPTQPEGPSPSPDAVREAVAQGVRVGGNIADSTRPIGDDQARTIADSILDDKLATLREPAPEPDAVAEARGAYRVWMFDHRGIEVEDGKEHHFAVGAAYHDELVRTPDGWRIASRREQQLFMEGSLPG